MKENPSGEEKPAIKSPAKRRVLYRAGELIILGLAAYGGIKGVNEGYHQVDNRVTNSTQTQDLKIINEELEGLSQEDKIQQYFDLRYSFGEFNRAQVGLGASDETEEFLRTKRKEVVLIGAFVLESIRPEVVIDTEAEKINAYNREFRLNNDFDMFLLDGIITKELTLQVKTRTDEDKYIIEKELEDLIWLANARPNIDVGADYERFYSSDYIILLARHRRVLSGLGYPLPAKTFYKAYKEGDPGVGWYSSGEDSVYVTEAGGYDTIVHEDAHDQADRNPIFNQKYFSQIMTSAMEKAGIEFRNADAYINWMDLEESDERILSEAYANNLQAFFTDGVTYRKRIKEFELAQNPAALVLAAQYEFAKDFYGGFEFIQSGEVFDPKIGDVFDISDPDGLRRGIGLRPDPTHLRLPNLPAVYDGDHVRIFAGPENRVDPYTGVAKDMWLVEPGVVIYTSEGEDFQPFEEKGWISEEWLGVIESHADAKSEQSDES